MALQQEIESRYESTTDVAAPLAQHPEPEVYEVDLAALGFFVCGSLWHHRKLIGRASLLGLLLTTLIVFLIPNWYSSTVRIMPAERSAESGMAMLNLLSGSPLLSALGSDLMGVKTPGGTLVGVLDSRTVKDRLIDRFNLKEEYGERKYEAARRVLGRHTAIAEDRKSGIISITVDDRRPQRAAELAEGYADELNRLLSDINTSAAHRERVFIEERLKGVSQDLAAAEADFSKFASKNTAIDIQAQGKALVDAAARLKGELIATQAELSGLEQIYTNQNVRVRALRAHAMELQQQLRKLGGDSDSSASPAAEDYPSIRQLPLLGVTYADLYRRMKIQEAIYETLTKQYELAKVEEAKESWSARVVDRAEIPEVKAGPSRLIWMVLGTVFSLVAAAAFVLGREYWRRLNAAHPLKVLVQTARYHVGVLSFVRANQ